MRHLAKSRRVRVVLVAAAAMVALTLLVGLSSLSNGASEETTLAQQADAQTPSSRSQSTMNALGHAAPVEHEERPQRPIPDCWTGLERTQLALSLTEFRAAARPLLASPPRDELLVRYLKERLAELIGSDEAKGLEVLTAALDADSSELSLLLAGLSSSEAVHKPAVAQRLIQMALDDKLDMGRREELLLALETQRTLPEKALEGLAAFAKDERSGEASVIAARTLGRVMGEDFQRTGDAARYTDKLLNLAANAPEEAVRSMALEMPMMADIPWDKQGMDRLSKLMTTDANEGVRELAAQNLSLGQDKKRAIEQFESAFQKEQDRCVRWALFRFAARAAGKQALPAMQQMATQDPRFQDSYRMFEKVYASGVQDFERVWLNLENQDPLDCLHEDGDET
jgi:hypothetical protein